MRLAFADEEDFPGHFAFWDANCERSLRGKKGRRVLEELEAALVEMPNKRLIAGALAKDGEVCAIGQLARSRGHGFNELEQVDLDEVTTDDFAELRVTTKSSQPALAQRSFLR